MDPRLTRLLVLLGQPWIEGPAEIDIAGMAAGGDDDALPGLNVHRIAAIHGGDSDHAPRVLLLADDLRHLVTQEDLCALFPRADLQPADEAGAVAIATGSDELAGNVPFDGHERARNGRGRFRTDHPVDELDPVLDQAVVGRDVLIGEDPHEITIAIAGRVGVETDPVGVDLIGRILDAVLLLHGVAAAQMQPSAAQDAAAADVVILVDRDHRYTVVACRDGGSKSRDAGADDD